MKKTLITLTVGTLLIASSGCSSTVTLGPKANQDGYLGAAASTKGVSVTVPFVKAETKTTPTTTTKKK
jgi:uncharacterized protein YceK